MTDAHFSYNFPMSILYFSEIRHSLLLNIKKHCGPWLLTTRIYQHLLPLLSQLSPCWAIILLQMSPVFIPSNHKNRLQTVNVISGAAIWRCRVFSLYKKQWGATKCITGKSNILWSISLYQHVWDKMKLPLLLKFGVHQLKIRKRIS
jgi:hypothetical protein